VARASETNARLLAKAFGGGGRGVPEEVFFIRASKSAPSPRARHYNINELLWLAIAP